MDINKTVNKLVKKYECANPFTLCKMLGIILVIQPLVNTKGMYKYFERNKIICIDSNLSYSEKMFVCAHELGHAIMHTKINTFFLKNNTFLQVDHYEVEANEFAVQLLATYVKEFGGELYEEIQG